MVAPVPTPIVVVGIGADGWDGLPLASRRAVEQADVVFGSARQVAGVQEHCSETRTWPSPLVPNLRPMIDACTGSRVCVLASGDPMFHGIGVTLAREFGADRLRMYPAPSSVSLACARLGWALHHTTTVSLVNSPAETVLPELADGRRILVLSRGSSTPGEIALVLSANGFGASEMTVLEQLGGPAERVARGIAGESTFEGVDPLNVVALLCVRDPDAARHTRIPGLADSAYTGDGQMTKREVRALTLSALAPVPGELLWDIGGGSGTIAIEWMRTDESCRAVTFESSQVRREQIETNARLLGVPSLVVHGGAPESFAAVSDAVPDAVFIGGGLTGADMLEACWDAVRTGGRVVANSVTAESDSLLLTAAAKYGGELRRFQIYRGEPLGAFTTWRPQLPVTQWSATKR
ncbi:precorrin-6y C5,15-methyltransferase (decarboxylating) subunit CbiE [Rhodococcus sp. IEGM 1401]|uniref:precorrin-6y C5,15-methyltransferase (decarboxylating) subunit CbiE n=1 Tax=unclassified Rhodococcus (in: high G+C Gram-positive bacteria) TaxID=192944 RepID=UPI0022B36863|nr:MULTISPECIES: precorrin-6y C5,15-methyltransferase (decarboxylating) subunit CbiE [unclassified Rhodococcus (in: high G+C Gram-positive bacteria)]MCZ4560272.1 precorrin-6y C5,15-methyltransferase (decarboxylating) subunit CbiE [Rhodococcus sp. IEGM 1401]MDI9920399.1 precorrin-6y C5,15-methyltransferase (decarboxylating) subunit CbiE [Rhodococcus sp. IEGM 1372]MDV8032915.1 precorrin-6y C5,15-methyltransferase (decarboxylating) subunit CbiE [Rhodococcus sp. IEGM 1414]